MNLQRRSHLLAYLQLAAWAAILVFAFFAFQELMLWGDPMLCLSPEHEVARRWIFRIFPLSTLRAAYLWYGSLNGRVSQALLSALTRELSRLFHFSPESFPVWILRGSSVFVLIAAPLNFLSLGRKSGISLGWLIAAGLALIYFWVLNPLSYIPAIWMDLTLLQYFLPIFILSVLSFRLPRLGVYHCLLYLFLSLCTEHYFVATPILFLAFAIVTTAERNPLTILKERVPYYAGLSLMAAALYLVSPGQHWRNGVFKKEFQPLYHSPWDWALKYQSMGYETLFGKTLSPLGFLGAHFLLYLAVIVALWRSYRRGQRKTFELSVLSLAFLLCYQGCMTTTWVSSYFPYYCALIPDLFLLLAIIYLALACLSRFSDVKQSLSAGSAIALSLIYIYGIVEKVPVVAQDYREAVQHSRMRRWISAEMRRKNQPERKIHFSVIGFPLTSFGTSIESEWAFRGYMEWVGMTNARALNEYDEKTIPIKGERIIISYADCPWKLTTRKISELDYGFFR